MSKILALDTETTGTDLYHGAMPFFVSTCNHNNQQDYWEWDVDPLTRKVLIPEEDRQEIHDLVLDQDTLILQNAKFDVAVLDRSGIIPSSQWPWPRTRDTLLAGHLLYSAMRHDLTAMAAHYLKHDLQPLEDALEKATDKARDLVRRHLPSWAIAAKDRQDMPSAKQKVWKYDTWLPRALCLWAREERWKWLESRSQGGNGGSSDSKSTLKTKAVTKVKATSYIRPWFYDYGDSDHPWLTVLQEYALADSAITLVLWDAQHSKIKERQLEAIFERRMKILPVVFKLEHGTMLTLSGERADDFQSKLMEESQEHGSVCQGIAASMGYDLKLPKKGINDSLYSFMFGEEGLHLEPVKETDTGRASLDKEALETYVNTLPPNTKELTFCKNLQSKNKRDSAISFIDTYRKFWIPCGDGWYILHPNLNPTGTATLRFSSSNPNEQNISEQEEANARWIFGPPPGWEWWDLDAQNIELRIPAYESGEQELIELFEHPNDPPYYGSVHLFNFSTVYPDIWEREMKKVGFEKVGPHCKKIYGATWYKWAKNGGLGMQYGAQEKTADRAFHRRGCYRMLVGRTKKLQAHNQRCIAHANKYGYVETIPDRSVDPDRGYPIMCGRGEHGIKPTLPLNYRTQSTAMWWTCEGMIRCDAKLEEWKQQGFLAHMVLQVHDSLVFAFSKSKTHPSKDFEVEKKTGKLPLLRTGETSNLWRVRILQGLMAKGGENIGIPTPVGVKYCEHNWAEGITM